jgi:hypothetical protein
MTTQQPHNEVLVPTLFSAFGLEACSDISLDPLVPAIYSFLTGAPVQAELAVQHGSEWYPSRAVTSAKGEATRFKRFAEKYQHVFSFNKDIDSLELKPGVLSGGKPHECDEWLYRIVLQRLHSTDPDIVERAVDDLDVSQ